MTTPRKTAQTAIGLFTLISLCFLGQDLLGSNEAGKLALALQEVDPNWNPHDWYLNTPQSYQWLFQQISGHLLQSFGIPLGTLLCRLVGYAVWAWAAATLCTALGLSTVMSLGAVGLFLSQQSLIAGEWMIGSAEPKTFAYATLLLAFVAWQRERWWRWGFWAGLASSFHILVGGYGTAALVLTGLLCRQPQRRNAWGRALTGLLLGASPILLALRGARPDQLQSSYTPQAIPSASWIYTYLRNPHHLVPSSWSSSAWLYALAVLTVFGVVLIWTLRDQSEPAPQRRAFGLWSACTLIPFAIGLVLSLWDTQGAWLRFYPFRVADSLIPLSTALLLACQLETLKPRLSRAGALLLASLIAVQLHSSWAHWPGLLSLPTPADQARLQTYDWLSRHTPPDALIATPPAGFEDMSLLTGRAGIAQFKQIPNRSTDLQEWFRRMQKLSGEADFWRHANGFKARRRLDQGFSRLSGEELEQIANTYGADILITSSTQASPTGWTRAFSNTEWIIWQPPKQSANQRRIHSDLGISAQNAANPRPINS